MSGDKKFSQDDYNDVPSRLRELRAKYPEASMQPVNPAEPFRVVEVSGKTFIAYAAACYRTPDDTRPGIGVAWEPFPGPTPFTKDSELQNAETSAWGRAIVAALVADAKRIASDEEINARRGGPPPAPADEGKLQAIRDLRASLPEDSGKSADELVAWAKDDDSRADAVIKRLREELDKLQATEAVSA